MGPRSDRLMKRARKRPENCLHADDSEDSGGDGVGDGDGDDDPAGIDSWHTPVGVRRHKVAGSEEQRGGGKDKGDGM